MAAADAKPDYCALTDLASTAIGAEVVFATDEWFAPAAMFLNPEPPVWNEDFTEFGKWMDGWETRRKRIPGHDWCLIRLGVAGVVRGFEIDTAFFTGNNVPAISVMGAALPDGPGHALPENLLDPATGLVPNIGKMGTAQTPQTIEAVKEALTKLDFFELLPKSKLRPGYAETRVHHFDSTSSKPVTHLLVNYYPDGGVARFRAFGEVISTPLKDAPASAAMDFAYALNGGVALCWSNAHYGSPQNTLLPGRAPNMGNGWETARNPNRPSILELGADGQVDFTYATDFFVLKLGARCDLSRAMIDTNHFKGNYPESLIIEVCDRPDILAKPVLEQKKMFEDAEFRKSISWKPLLKRTKMVPHAERTFEQGDAKAPLEAAGAATHARVTILPDGGVSRLRLYGRPAAGGSSKM
eukprot:TRINITY_DN18850_c0_g1_i1.p1 TRINITY_DN18850_c0_g1~~TRINITY_DN18850_c0_g1_i1.p1  ORF type:complete len:412 (-),score=76.22 TRINITY_DN18850_c0_g1_i1:349-1584(-)